MSPLPFSIFGDLLSDDRYTHSMPRVRVYLGCSLDGCIAGPDGDISFLSEFAPERSGGSF